MNGSFCQVGYKATWHIKNDKIAKYMTRNKWEKRLVLQMPHLLRYAKALTRNNDMANDLVQDCLERAWNKRRLWNSQRTLRPWLLTIMHNIFINQKCKQSNNQETTLEELTLVDEGADASQLVQLRDLQVAMGKLSPEYREIILLAGLESLSYKEIAKVTGLPLGTVMSRLSRAREKLRKIMNSTETDNVVQLR